MPVIGPWIDVLAPEVVGLSTDTKAYKAAAKAASAFTRGRVLTIDPSSGSYSSMPGYAIRVDGELREWGTIELTPGVPIWVRLRQLAAALRADFSGHWDALVIEDVPLMRFGRGGRGSVGKQLPLLNAVAVIMASVASDHVIEVRPRQWRAYLPDSASYSRNTKADDADACMLDYAAAAMAAHARARAEACAARHARAAARMALRSQRPDAQDTRTQTKPSKSRKERKTKKEISE